MSKTARCRRLKYAEDARASECVKNLSTGGEDDKDARDLVAEGEEGGDDETEALKPEKTELRGTLRHRYSGSIHLDSMAAFLPTG
jgi:hypothetical protein